MNKRDLYKQLEDHFRNNPFAYLELEVDDFKVSIHHEFANNKLAKVIYINGVNKGVWINNEDFEETKRFAYVQSKYLHSSNGRKALVKMAKWRKDKKEREEAIERANARYVTRIHFFKCAIGTVLKQWIKRDINKSIILLDDHNGNENLKLK